MGPSAQAQDALHLTTVSYHFDRTPGGGTVTPNEWNGGLGGEWTVGRGALYVGGYYNTMRTLSLYGGYARGRALGSSVRVGAVAGVVTGYPVLELGAGVSLVPGVLPFVEVGQRRIAPRLYVVPFRGGVVALQFRIRT